MEHAKLTGQDSSLRLHRKLQNDALSMIKWYRGEIRYVPRRNANGIIEVDADGHTVYTSIVEYEDMGVIKMLANKALKLKEHANLGARFSERTFANFDKRYAPTAYEQCRIYADRDDLFESDKNGLMIIGSVGTGKTHLAASIANYMVERGVPTQFGTYIDFLEAIRQEYDAEGKREKLSRIKNTMMLVIDDLGKEKRTEWTQQTLYDVINYRYEHRLPIVITSNMEPDAMKAHVGDAVYSRLYEMCGAVIMNGKDYRRTA